MSPPAFTAPSYAKLAAVVLPKRMQLAGGDLVALDGVVLGLDGAHVLDEAPSDRGRHSIGLLGTARI